MANQPPLKFDFESSLLAASGTEATGAETRIITSSLVGTHQGLDVIPYGTMDVNIIGGGGSNVNVVTGTQQTLGTLGTALGIGSVSNIGSITNIGSLPVLAINQAVGTNGNAIPAVEVLIGIRNTAGNISYIQGFNANGDTVTSPAGGNLVGVASFPFMYNGATMDRVRGDATNGLLVNLGTNNDVIQSTHDNFNANTNLQVSNTDVSNSNPVPTNHSVTGIGHGVKTVTSAGTDEALAGSTTAREVTIQAQTDNTGLIAVGATGVDATVATGTGIILYPGDSITLECDNLSDIFVDATVSGDGVRFTYLT